MYVTDLTAKRGPLWFLPIAPEIENPEENPSLLLTGIYLVLRGFRSLFRLKLLNCINSFFPPLRLIFFRNRGNEHTRRRILLRFFFHLTQFFFSLFALACISTLKCETFVTGSRKRIATFISSSSNSMRSMTKQRRIK